MTIRAKVAPAILGAVMATAAAAAAPPVAHDQCFLRRNVNGFSAPNDRTLYVRVGVNDVWRLDLMTDCTGLSFRNAFGLEAQPARAWICSPLDATVVFRQTGLTQRCPVSGLHKLTADEIAALPRRDRP